MIGLLVLAGNVAGAAPRALDDDAREDAGPRAVDDLRADGEDAGAGARAGVGEDEGDGAALAELGGDADDVLAEGAQRGAPLELAPTGLLADRGRRQLGRVELALAWRHADRDPRTREPYTRDELWLVATWRR